MCSDHRKRRSIAISGDGVLSRLVRFSPKWRNEPLSGNPLQQKMAVRSSVHLVLPEVNGEAENQGTSDLDGMAREPLTPAGKEVCHPRIFRSAARLRWKTRLRGRCAVQHC